MSLSRRHFLLGTAGAAAGLILPSYYRRALEFLDRTGSPLLEPEGTSTQILTAYDYAYYGDDLKYGLALGEFDPEPYPPELTLRQFAERYGVDPEELLESYESEKGLDALVDWHQEYFLDTWMYWDCPERKAYEFLKGLDLGPELVGRESIGHVHLEVGGSPASICWIVGTHDDISLSLLQDRLNALRTGVEIVMA